MLKFYRRKPKTVAAWKWEGQPREYWPDKLRLDTRISLWLKDGGKVLTYHFGGDLAGEYQEAKEGDYLVFSLTSGEVKVVTSKDFEIKYEELER